MRRITWKQVLLVGGLLVVASIAIGAWAACRAIAADTLEIRNELDQSLQVRISPADLCADKVIERSTSGTYRGGWLCQDPVEVHFTASGINFRCSWKSAKEHEPIVVTHDGVNCRLEVSLQIENHLDEPVTVEASQQYGFDCPRQTIRAGSSTVWTGDILCQFPYRIGFRALNYYVRCDWLDAKAQEPAVVSRLGVTCSDATPASE